MANLHGNFLSIYAKAFPLLSGSEAQRRASEEWGQFKQKYKKCTKDPQFCRIVEERINELKKLTVVKKVQTLDFFLRKVPVAGASKSSHQDGATGESTAHEDTRHGATGTSAPGEGDPEAVIATYKEVQAETAVARQTARVIGSDEGDEADKEAVDGVVTDEDSPGHHRRRRAQPLLSSDDDDHKDGDRTKRARKYRKPAQEGHMKAIVDCEFIITKLKKLKDQGLATESILRELKEAEKKKEAEINKLKRAESLQKAQLKFREKQRAQKPQAQNAPLSTAGRPRIPDEEALIATISELAVHGSAADGRRRTEVMRACRTLDELTTVLKERGYNLSRSATYLRLIPARANTQEGKLHVKTAPVKLTRAENDQHKSHPDGKFCVASIRNAESIASLLGSSHVAVLSKDDKCRIPLGIAAATKEAPLLMHMEYRVRLPDHDWVVGSRHKLIPSVYAGIKIINKSPIGQTDAVSYSGPTYVAIRSGKHSSSTATTHAIDFERLLKLEGFQSIMHTSSGEVKPVLVVFVDGGPDENPRYRKVIAETVKAFKAHNLDYIITVTNAPGRSAFNRVERRMAPLSRMLAGLVLEHNHYGSHLDSQGRTVDSELEKQNFEFAGKTLAEVWNTLSIDGESVVAEYVPPSDQDTDESTDGQPGTKWYAAHVRESQYMLQVAKCEDERCCTPLRSQIRLVLPDGFLPPPLLLSDGLQPAQPLSRDCHYAPLFVQLAVKVKFPSDEDPVPYDFYCPTIQKQLKSRCCSICGLYFASQVSVKEHKRNAHNMATLTDIQARAGTSEEGSARRSARLAARKGEVLTELQDENGQPIDVEWVAAAEEEGDDWDDNVPLAKLISNTAEWTQPLWSED